MHPRDLTLSASNETYFCVNDMNTRVLVSSQGRLVRHTREKRDWDVIMLEWRILQVLAEGPIHIRDWGRCLGHNVM